MVNEKNYLAEDLGGMAKCLVKNPLVQPKTLDHFY
jgi:hypothetical protein